MDVSWIIKKTEHWRIDTFELWCWSRLWRELWTARRSNQSIIKEINPEYAFKWLMLKVQYFGHLMQTANSLENTLILGKTEGRRRKGWQKMRCLDGITTTMDMSSIKLQKMVKDKEAWRAAVHAFAKSRIPLSNWTTTMNFGDTHLQFTALPTPRLNTSLILRAHTAEMWLFCDSFN